MPRRFRIEWASLLELAPHLLCIATLASGKNVLTEEALRNPPFWARTIFVVAALALIPVCYMAGKSVLRWPKRWMVATLTAGNGVMAALAGVCIGLLGMAVYFESTVRMLGAATLDLFWWAGSTGAILGLFGFLIGLARRPRHMSA